MPSTSESKPKLSADELASLISTLQLEMLSVKTRLAESETRNDSLQETIVNLAHENELLKRRLFGTKSERLIPQLVYRSPGRAQLCTVEREPKGGRSMRVKMGLV